MNRQRLKRLFGGGKTHVRVPSVEGAVNLSRRIPTCPHDWCAEPHPHYHRGDPTRFAGKGGS